jgi:hypothetical protein
MSECDKNWRLIIFTSWLENDGSFSSFAFETSNVNEDFPVRNVLLWIGSSFNIYREIRRKSTQSIKEKAVSFASSAIYDKSKYFDISARTGEEGADAGPDASRDNPS